MNSLEVFPYLVPSPIKSWRQFTCVSTLHPLESGRREFQLVWSSYSHSQRKKNSFWPSLSNFLPCSYLSCWHTKWGLEVLRSHLVPHHHITSISSKVHVRPLVEGVASCIAALGFTSDCYESLSVLKLGLCLLETDSDLPIPHYKCYIYTCI